MKNILIAPDSFKDSLKSKEVAKIIFKTLKKKMPNNHYQMIPISDGGEGLTHVLSKEVKKVKVTGPLGKPVTGLLGFNHDTCIIEMASSSGLEYVKNDLRNPYHTTSYGFGELIIEALKYHPKKLILGMGGSATNDLGLGALKALGVKFYNKEKEEVGIYGKDLFEVESVDIEELNETLNEIEIIVAVDVNNTLLGPSGATYIFGPQKGLQTKDLKRFDEAFKKVSLLLNKAFSKDNTNIFGSGAAGGLSYSMSLFKHSQIRSGFDVVSKMLDLKNILKKTDILITGEGKMDLQTEKGKAPFALASYARKINKDIKVYAFVGTLVKSHPVFDDVIMINKKEDSLETSLKKSKKNLKEKVSVFASKYL